MGKRECEREGEAGGLTIYRQASNQKWTIARERPTQDAMDKRSKNRFKIDPKMI